MAASTSADSAAGVFAAAAAGAGVIGAGVFGADVPAAFFGDLFGVVVVVVEDDIGVLLFEFSFKIVRRFTKKSEARKRDSIGTEVFYF